MDGAIKCKHCGSNIGTIPKQPETVAQINSEKKLINDISGVTFIESLKAPNAPCLWVSLDYWNLYLFEDKIVALRCYRGWYGIIGFIVGFFFAFIGSLIVGALGILLDKQQGEAKCAIMKNRLNEALSNRKKYKLIESTWKEVNGPDVSDLCLGSFWLKYKIRFGGQSFFFEDSRYEQIDAIIKKYKNINI